jgi:hypothetical protein
MYLLARTNDHEHGPSNQQEAHLMRETLVQDSKLSLEQLQEKYSLDGESQHFAFPRDHWTAALASGKTSLDYWQWVRASIVQTLQDETFGVGVAQLQFALTIHGVVDVNDGDTRTPKTTADELTHQLRSSAEWMINNGGLTGLTPAVVDHFIINVQAASSLSTNNLTVEMLRQQGCAVVVFTAEEMGNADQLSVQNRLADLGQQVISDLLN